MTTAQKIIKYLALAFAFFLIVSIKTSSFSGSGFGLGFGLFPLQEQMVRMLSIDSDKRTLFLYIDYFLLYKVFQKYT